MNRSVFSVALAVVFGVTATAAALAQAAPGGMAGAMDMSAVPAASITWTDAKIPGFPPGMKMAVINGTRTRRGLSIRCGSVSPTDTVSRRTGTPWPKT